ncbi:Uncharacterized protein APZ42_018824 [Daphnia magna]|uniref:Uncharacterized protein n=1 Tax=Daphnia magna TaxID=35525 RepID=A0A164YTL3_9CRUS|nr:Uncharacterized protein APZ42_018824 [Daphnia magna]
MRPRKLQKGECLEIKWFQLLPIISFHGRGIRSNRFNCRFFEQTGYYNFSSNTLSFHL